MTALPELKNLSPLDVWSNFFSLVKIPRPSKSEGKVIEFLEGWAKSKGFKSYRDSCGNLCVHVEANGCSSTAPVILQNHVDIVAVTRAGAIGADAAQGMIPIARGEFSSAGDFREAVNGAWLYSHDTTMGADNGVGCAIGMAIATDPKLVRPPLQLLFTLDEEEGMSGVKGLDVAALHLDGQYMINIDTEDDDEITIGSAGGCNVSLTFKGKQVEANSGTLIKLEVKDLTGGHSGVEIASGRANANRLLARCLSKIAEQVPLQIVDVQGGNRRNAIPQSSSCQFIVASDKAGLLKEIIANFRSEMQIQYEGVERTITFEVGNSSISKPTRAFDKDSTATILRLLAALPHGVLAMDPDLKDLVQSSCNLALVNTLADAKIKVDLSCRSTTEAGIRDILDSIQAVAQLTGCEYTIGDSYPGWKPNVRSKLLAVVRDLYEEMFQSKPKVKAIHAGLECGLLLQKLPKAECVSIGPNIRGNHAPGERVEIGSVQKMYDLIVRVLEELAKS